MGCRSFVPLLLLLTIAAAPLRAQPAAPAAPPRMAEGIGVSVERIGPQKVIIPSGQHGLVGFPDEGITFLSRKPLSFLLVAGVSTRLMQGSSLATAKPVGEVIAPSSPGGPDNGYAGVSAVITDPKNGTIRAFYHAEDWEGYDTLGINGINNFLASVCLATCPAEGKEFTKRGPVITGPDAKDTTSKQPQGVGTASILPTPGGKYLLAWFTVYSPAEGRGSEIGMARATAESGGEAGSWWKWHDGDFTEPGLGGRGTPVVSFQRKGAATDPCVVWVPECRRYLMVFTGIIHGDVKPDSDPQGGIWVACSREGIAWSEPVRLVKAIGVPCTGRECAMHPSLVINSATADTVDATLLYGYSPSWGMTVEAPSHHLVGRSIRLSVTGGK